MQNQRYNIYNNYIIIYIIKFFLKGTAQKSNVKKNTDITDNTDWPPMHYFQTKRRMNLRNLFYLCAESKINEQWKKILTL